MSTIQGIPAAGLVEGPYSFSVNAVDAAGNHGPSNTYNFTVGKSAQHASFLFCFGRVGSVCSVFFFFFFFFF